MPAPRGEIYTQAAVPPTDTVLRKAMTGLPWDEVLAGAASGVALDLIDGVSTNAYRLRWAAILAGWPFPILSFNSFQSGYDDIPKDLLVKAQAAAAKGQVIGVSRGRQADGDIWVLLVSERRGDLGPIPRDPGLGDTLPLLGASFVLADPEGRIQEVGAGDFPLQRPGEWLLEAYDSDGRKIAVLPLFVGGTAPLAPPIVADISGPTDISTLQLYNSVRNWYGLEDVEREMPLDSVARARLKMVRDGSVLPQASAMLGAAGYLNVPTAAAECQAATVASCLDGIWWSADKRWIFQGDFSVMGIASEAVDGGVRLVLVASG